MAPLAATATDALGPNAVLLLILIVVTLGYLCSCWIYPFTTCRRCRGTGNGRLFLTRTPGLCRRCEGTGKHLRLGRHVINHARALHANANRYQRTNQRTKRSGR